MVFSTKMSIAGLLVLGCLAINSASKKADIVPQCGKDQTGNMTYPPNCILYVECWYGEGLVLSCFHDEVFHPTKLICVPKAELPSCQDGGFIDIHMETEKPQAG